jgi:molecular chaperone GrpE
MAAKPIDDRDDIEPENGASDAPGKGRRDAVRTGELEPEHAHDVDRLLAERDELKASWQRAAADYQNLRRRMQSDIDAAVARAKKALHLELLLVVDYLDMALATPCTSADAKALLAGVEMTRAQLLGVLEREGIRPMPEGGTFDASLHQAVERDVTDEVQSGTILATMRKGYTVGGQILRPAQVRVAVATGDERASG